MRNTSLFWLTILRLNCLKFSYGTFLKAIFQRFIILFDFLVFGCPGSSVSCALFFFSSSFSELWLLCSCGVWDSRCGSFSYRGADSRVQAQWLWHHGLSWSAACGIFLDQGSNPCLLHWQADSEPPRILSHQGSLGTYSLLYKIWQHVPMIFWIFLPYQRRQWHPTPVLLPGKSHGQRSLVGCSPWGR